MQLSEYNTAGGYLNNGFNQDLICAIRDTPICTNIDCYLPNNIIGDMKPSTFFKMKFC